MPSSPRPRSSTGLAARGLGLALGLAAAAGLAAPNHAHAAVAIEGTFSARAACPAYQSFNAGSNPGGVVLEPGTVYGAFEMNLPDGPWVRLRVPGADPINRWVARECGRLDRSDAAAANATASEPPPLSGPTDPGGPAMVNQPTPLVPRTTPAAVEVSPLDPATSAAPPVAARPRPGHDFRPVFDTVNQGPQDPTPAPPRLGPVDLAVLNLCGDWGAPVSPADFRSFLDAQPSLRDSLKATLGGDESALVRAWFDADGFRHILCGEPDQRGDDGWSLGGLHYMGRYLQAQRNGWLGLLQGGCSVVEIDPPIYTSGVEFLTPDGGIATKCVNGYALGLTAPDILLEVTKILRLARDGFGGREDACRYRVLDDGNAYYAVFVMRDGAIRTFYPDATIDESLPVCGQ